MKNAKSNLREVIRSIIVEAGPGLDMMHIDSEVSMDAVHGPAQDLAMDLTLDVIHKFDKMFEPDLIEILNSNLVGVETPHAGGGKAWDVNALARIENAHEDEYETLHQDCAHEIADALTKYAVAVASMFAHNAYAEDDHLAPNGSPWGDE